MTIRRPSPRTGTRAGGERSPERTLERRIRSARYTLLAEQVWPRVWFPLTVLCLFLIASFAGLWPLLSTSAHKAVLAVFAIAGIASLAPFARIASPTRDDAMRRLEKASGIPHRPASSYTDTLAATRGALPDVKAAQTLWRAHRTRLSDLIERLTPGRPHPRVDRRDPFALRAALMLATGIAAIFAMPDWEDRLRSAFNFASVQETLTARLDAWLTPPRYTRKPPMILADGSKARGLGGDEARIFTVPVGSALIVRASGPGHENIRIAFRLNEGEEKSETGLAPDAGKAAQDTDKPKPSLTEFRTTIRGEGTLVVHSGDRRIKGWQFKVIPDDKPVIALTKDPSTTPRGALSLNYQVRDDYGVASADANFALTERSRADAGATADSSLWPAPKFPLKLTRRNARKLKSNTFKDLTAHPWAGLEVDMTLSAVDVAAQTGTSKPRRFRLPARKFRKPLARAVVEQRRKLALNPASRPRRLMALEALTIAPELFIKDVSVYLGLRSVYWRLSHNRSQENLKSAVDQLWDIALRIEDGDLSQAERDLRAAQDRLSQALKDGASEEEIRQLTKELREAMNRFLDSMARQARQQNPNNPQQQQLQTPNGRSITQQDLDQMLRDIENLARSGSRDAAQQMLSELRNMLERLQAGQQGNQQQSGRMQETIRDFGRLIQDQKQLMDDTFQSQRGQGRNQQGRNGRQRNGRQGQRGLGQLQEGQQGRRGQRGQRGQGQQGQQGQRQFGRGQRGQSGQGLTGRDGNGQFGGLGDRQRGLSNQLGRLMEGLQGFGAQVPGQLDEAQRAMRDAEQSLQDGAPGRATREQSRALDNLRAGTQQMVQEMMQGMQRQFGQRGQRDPLGRTGPNNGGLTADTGVQIPGEIDIQRARRILEELRRRVSDPSRPSLELDYLERLLERF